MAKEAKMHKSIHGVLWVDGKQSSIAMRRVGDKWVPAKPYNTRKQAKNRHNRMIRANLNREYAGEAGSKNAALYHQKLKEISLGIA